MRLSVFSYLCPGDVFALPAGLPGANGGARARARWPFIGADGVMVARTLAAWKCASTTIICNDLGADVRGRETLATLHGEGVTVAAKLRPDLQTPYEVDLVDALGNRAFIVQESACWATCGEADTSSLAGADALYADFYAFPGVPRAVRAAAAADVPVYLNADRSLDAHNRALIAQSRWAQISMAEEEDAPLADAVSLARAAQALGPALVIVTRGRHGAVAFDGRDLHVAPAPQVAVQDAQGAGAAFAAAMLCALLDGRDADAALAFAVRVGSTKVGQQGLLKALPAG
ncbi:MAG: hypothetical protein K1X39_03810 [Thermoflexales bacterium]|nr:hypothetical protein [Thermoflexales bacterium]